MHRLPGCVAVIALLLLFFGLWCHDLGRYALSGDEAFVALMADEPMHTILRRLNTDEPHPPAYYMLMRAWQVLSDAHSEFVVRFPSVCLGVLLLSLMYRLGRELSLGQGGALAALLFVALNPQLTVHYREARMYGLMAVGCALAVLTAVRFPSLSERKRLWMVTAANALALMSHYLNMLFIGALGIWGVFHFKGELRKRWLYAQGAAWVILAFWLLLMGRGFLNPTSLSQGKTWSVVLPPWESLTRLIGVGLLGYRDVSGSKIATLVGGVFLVGAWLAGSLDGAGRKCWLLVVGAALPLLAYALMGWVKPVFHPKYVLPWLLFAALGLGRLLSLWPRVGKTAFLVLAAVMVVPWWNTVRKPYDPGLVVPRDAHLETVYRDLSIALAELFGPDDVFALGTPDPAHCYYARHYTNRDLGCVLVPGYPGQPADELASAVCALLDQHDVLWYLGFRNEYWDPEGVGESVLEQCGFRVGQENIAERTLYLFTSRDTILRDLRPIGARFGRMIVLRGFWAMRRGDVHVVLVLQSLRNRPNLDAKVSLQWVDESGRTIAQDDCVPVRWTRPLNTWERGEQILDAHSLSLPEGVDISKTRLRVAFYVPSTMQRLPAYDAQGRHLPEDMVIIPGAEIALFTEGR